MVEIENPEPSFFKERRYSNLNPRFPQIRYELIDPIPATGTNERGFGEIEEFHFFKQYDEVYALSNVKM